MWFLGIDIGTTHIKVVGVTADGDILPSLKVRTPVSRVGGLDFHHGEDIWLAVKLIVEEYAARIASGAGELGGITIATFGQEEAFPVDRAGRPIYPSLAWWERWPEPSLTTDLAEEFDSPSHYAVSGVRFRSNQTPDRIAHLQLREDRIWKNAQLWVDFGSFVTWKLTGTWVTSSTQISHSQLYNVATGEPDPRSFEAVHLSPELFPPVALVAAPVAEIQSGVLFGVKLSNSASVYVGGHDQVVAAYTSTLTTGATVVDSIGTAEYLMIVTESFRTDQEFYSAGVEIEAGWCPGQYVVGWGIPTGKIFQTVAALCFDGDFEAFLDAIGGASRDEPSATIRLNDLRGESGLLSIDNIAAGATPQAIARRVADQIALDTQSIVSTVAAATQTTYDRVAVTGSLFQRHQMLQHRRRFWDVPLEIDPIDEAVATGAAWIARSARTTMSATGVVQVLDS